MSDRIDLSAELEEQLCVIEGQQVEILRQNHQIEMLRRLVAHLESELEATMPSRAMASAAPAWVRQK